MGNLSDTKKFEWRHSQTLTETKEAVLALQDFAARYFFGEENNYSSFWFLLSAIVNSLGEEIMEDWEKNMENRLLALFDAAGAKRFLYQLRVWLGNLSFRDLPAGEKREDNIAGQQIMPAGVFAVELDKLFFSDNIKKEIIGNYALLSDAQKTKAGNHLQILGQLLADLHFQLELIASFFRINRDWTLYSLQEFASILSGETAVYDGRRLAATLRDYMSYDKEGVKAVDEIYEYLRIAQVQKKHDYTWEDAFFMTVFLYFVFHFFNRLHPIQQEFWLNYYFVKAVTADVPVRKILEYELYNETDNPADYVNYVFLFYEAIRNNQEDLLVNDRTQQILEVAEIIKNYLSRTGDRFNDGYLREQFISELISGASKKGRLQDILREILYIFCHLKSVDLVETNKGSAVTEKDFFEHQLERLLIWWLEEDLWPLLVKYYTEKNEQNVVPLKALLRYIQANENLDKNEIVDKLLKFSSFLKQENVLRGEDDLILFHESDNEFHWNSEVVG